MTVFLNVNVLPTIVKHALMLLTPALLLVAWPWVAEQAGCLWAALNLAIPWLFLGLGLAEAAYLRRMAFIGVFLVPERGLSRLLQPGWLTALLQFLKGLLLLLILMTGLMSLNIWQQGVLLLDAWLFAGIHVLLDNRLGGQFRPEYKDALLRQWSNRLNALLLWPMLLAASFLGRAESITGSSSWRQVLQESALQVDVACEALALLARIRSVSEGLSVWAWTRLESDAALVFNLMPVGLVIVLIGGVSFLLSWLYSRVLTGVLAAPDYFRRRQQ